MTLQLAPGDNLIALIHGADDLGGVNVDHLVLGDANG